MPEGFENIKSRAGAFYFGRGLFGATRLCKTGTSASLPLPCSMSEHVSTKPVKHSGKGFAEGVFAWPVRPRSFKMNSNTNFIPKWRIYCDEPNTNISNEPNTNTCPKLRIYHEKL